MIMTGIYVYSACDAFQKKSSTKSGTSQINFPVDYESRTNFFRSNSALEKRLGAKIFR